MKTLLALLTTGLTLNTAVVAQDFLAFPPFLKPNSAELAYFSGQYPAYIAQQTSNEANVRLVVDFLNNLANNQPEAAIRQIADGFTACGPAYQDCRDANTLLQEADHTQRLFNNQVIQISHTDTKTAADGAIWVYVAGEWSAQDVRHANEPISLSFHQLAQVHDGKIVTIHLSYAQDRLYYDLGFPIYDRAGQTAATKNR